MHGIQVTISVKKSIDGQIRECKEFAEKNDIRIIDTYIDRALSAKNGQSSVVSADD